MNYITNFNAITSRETDRVASYPTKSVQSDFEVSGNNILHIRWQALQYAFYVHLFPVAGKHSPLVSMLPYNYATLHLWIITDKDLVHFREEI